MKGLLGLVLLLLIGSSNPCLPVITQQNGNLTVVRYCDQTYGVYWSNQP
jgi:hypothetical protein